MLRLGVHAHLPGSSQHHCPLHLLDPLFKATRDYGTVIRGDYEATPQEQPVPAQPVRSGWGSGPRSQPGRRIFTPVKIRRLCTGSVKRGTAQPMGCQPVQGICM